VVAVDGEDPSLVAGHHGGHRTPAPVEYRGLTEGIALFHSQDLASAPRADHPPLDDHVERAGLVALAVDDVAPAIPLLAADLGQGHQVVDVALGEGVHTLEEKDALDDLRIHLRLLRARGNG